MNRSLGTLCPLIVAMACVGLGQTPALAGHFTATWTGGGGDGLYSNPANWDIGVVPCNDETDTFDVILVTTGLVFMDVDDVCDVTDLTLGSGQTFRINAGHTYTVLDDAAINGVIETENSTFRADAPGASFGDDDNARLDADGGGVISIAATVYSSAALGSTQTLFRATGAGTLIDLPMLQSIDAGFDDFSSAARVHTITLSADAMLDLSSVQTLIGPVRGEDRFDLLVSSDASIALPALQEIFAAGSGDVRFDLNILSYSLPSLLTASDTWFALQSGTALSLPSLTHFGGRFDVPVGASVNATSLLEISNSTISVLPGGTFNTPNATTFTNSSLAVEAGQIITLPAFVNMDNSRFDVSGGVLFAVAAPAYSSTGLGSTQTLITAQGAGTLVDWSSVGLLDAGFDDFSSAARVHTVNAVADAVIDLSNVQTLIAPRRGEDRLDLIVATGGDIMLTGLQEIYGASAGRARFELNVPGYTLPALLSAAETDFDLMPGTALDLPGLVTFGGSFDVPADASVDAISLLEIRNSTISVLPGGSFSAPNAVTFTNSMLTVEAGQLFDLPTLVNIDNSRFDVRGGVSFQVAAAEYASTGLGSTQMLINAQGTGTLVDWSTVGLFDAGFNDNSSATRIHTIRAQDGALLDLSNVASLVTPARGEDRVDVLAMTGATIDLALLAGSTGTGSLRFSIADAVTLVDLSRFSTFDRPTQVTIESASTVRLAGLGVIGSGSFVATDDVGGYPAATVGGSVRNETQMESSFRTGDLKLTMTGEYGTFEAAAEDLGAADPGTDVFEFGELTFVPPPPEECPPLIVFVENFDNGNRGGGETLEAVYFTGHDGFDGIPALNGGTLVLRGLNVYTFDGGAWINLQDLTPPIGTAPYKDGFLANIIEVLAGDVNGDTSVDFADILLILGTWGMENPFVDQTGDGLVDFSDILEVLANWGATGCPSRG